MKKTALLMILCAALAAAQTAETIPFRAVLLASNETPAVDLNASGDATILAHVVRNQAGDIVSGSVDFYVSYAFPAAVTLTGLHIHSGAAGVNGPVVINTGIGPTAPVTDPSGRGSLNRQAQVRPTDTAALAALKGLIADPAQFYVNAHTPEFPAGVIRGQLQRADMTVVLGLASPANEVPAVPVDASGICAARVLVARDSSGAITSGSVIFDFEYTFPDQTTFTGFHIHSGPAGVNGPVVIGTPIGAGAASVPSSASGAGRLQYLVPVAPGSAAGLRALEGLFTNPENYYMNLHTPQFPAGVIRAQLRRTDTMAFPVMLSASNETPPITGLDASATGIIVLHTIRNVDGSVRAGVTDFNLNFCFPDAVEFTGLHIHEGAAGIAGPVRISSGLSGTDTVASDSGFGNVFRQSLVGDLAGVSTLDAITGNPAGYYVNLHNRAYPAGVVRAQLAAPNTAPPVVNAVVVAGQLAGRSVVAPLGLISIYGSNLAKVTGNLDGWRGANVPASLNNTVVVLGSRYLPVLYVSPTQINAQVPAESAPGPLWLSVNNGNAPSAPVMVQVAQSAPNIFFYPDTGAGVVVRASDFSLVSAGNPAQADDLLIAFATGLGQTTPALATGDLTPLTATYNTPPVTATLGGKSAAVVGAAASPGYLGLYQVAFRVPAGLAAGSVPLVLNPGSAASNTVSVAVR